MPRTKSRRSALSVKDVPKPEPLPDAINGLAEPLRQQVADAWHACRFLTRAIDLWRSWLEELKINGDADPAVPSRLQEGCFRAAGTLQMLGAFSPTFRELEHDEIMAKFPPSPDPRRKDWDGSRLRDRTPWNQHKEYLRSCNELWLALWGLQGELALLQRHLEDSPSIALADSETDAWSSEKSPAEWEKFFGVTWKTIARRIKAGKYTARQVTTKCWQFALHDIPEKHRAVPR